MQSMQSMPSMQSNPGEKRQRATSHGDVPDAGIPVLQAEHSFPPPLCNNSLLQLQAELLRLVSQQPQQSALLAVLQQAQIERQQLLNRIQGSEVHVRFLTDQMQRVRVDQAELLPVERVRAIAEGRPGGGNP